MNRLRFVLVPAALVASVFSSFAPAHAQKQTNPAVKPAAAGAKSASPKQATVAAKDKTFGTIAAGDAKVKSANDAKNLTEAKKFVGKTGTFSGTVAGLFEPNGLVLINFDRDYKSALTAVVRSANFAKFPDLKTLEGKKVLVSGKVVDYKGTPELVLAALDDIKIIK